MKDIIMENVREYCEEYEVKLVEFVKDNKTRFGIVALNEGTYNSTMVDLLDVIKWVKENKPELLK